MIRFLKQCPSFSPQYPTLPQAWNLFDLMRYSEDKPEDVKDTNASLLSIMSQAAILNLFGLYFRESSAASPTHH